jgi:hypothetical protein
MWWPFYGIHDWSDGCLEVVRTDEADRWAMMVGMEVEPPFDSSPLMLWGHAAMMAEHPA